MLYRGVWATTLTLAIGSTACDPTERLTQEQTPRGDPPAALTTQATPSAEPTAVSAGTPPVLGDPLGLLSKKPGAGAATKRDPGKLDPGALTTSAKQQPVAMASLERDPRAVARGSSVIIDRRASTTVRDVTFTEVRNAVLARPRPHVLFFYGAYCPACRNVMPKFVEAVRGYGGATSITAVSIDADRADFEAYVPALGGVIEPLLLEQRVPGGFRKNTEELGITWGSAASDGVSIPYIAVFDARGRVVRQGGSNEVARIAKTLREL